MFSGSCRSCWHTSFTEFFQEGSAEDGYDMWGDVRYNTWLQSLLSRWILGGGCLTPAWVCRVTFLPCSAFVRCILVRKRRGWLERVTSGVYIFMWPCNKFSEAISDIIQKFMTLKVYQAFCGFTWDVADSWKDWINCNWKPFKALEGRRFNVMAPVVYETCTCTE